MEKRRDKDNEVSRGVWKIIEAKARKTGISETKERRKKRRERKEARREREKEERKKEKETKKNLKKRSRN